jgi:hypothetical protein
MAEPIAASEAESERISSPLWSRETQYPSEYARGAGYRRGTGVVDALVAVTARHWEAPHEATARHVRTSTREA